MIMDLTVGQPVHYRSHGSKDGTYEPQCRTAILTQIGGWRTVRVRSLAGAEVEGRGLGERLIQQIFDPEFCYLRVFNPTGDFLNECGHCEPDDQGESIGGTWHVPCGV